MKILFLDIDGVLNSARTVVAAGGFPHNFSEEHMKRFDHVAIGLIRHICDETGAKIVLSSTWREHFTAQQVSEALDLPVIDVTPILNTLRGREIQLWLQSHPEVEHYAIVDDNDQMLSEQKEFFVKTNPIFGLTTQDTGKLVAVLNGKPQAEADQLLAFF